MHSIHVCEFMCDTCAPSSVRLRAFAPNQNSIFPHTERHREALRGVAMKIARYSRELLAFCPPAALRHMNVNRFIVMVVFLVN